MKAIISLLASMALIVCIIVLIVGNNDYCDNIEDNLKHAARATNLQGISDYLQIAITNIEKNGLTNGSTEIISAPQGTTDSNITDWYQGICNAKAGIDSLMASTQGRITADQYDNLLSKAQMSLRAIGISDENVAEPWFICVYPNHRWVVIIGIICIIALFAINRGRILG